MIKKECLKYYFSVEGKTEKWYLNWLQDQINHSEKAVYNVKFKPFVEKNPKKVVKQLTILQPLEILHVFDFEELRNEASFQNTLFEMKQASQLKRRAKYILGYCNYTFDLWMILHKECLLQIKTCRSQYLTDINRCFHQSFESMSEYKKEDNFKQVLHTLTLDDVLNAIKNAEKITQKNEQSYQKIKYSKYEYYRENPSLNLHEYIKKILIDVGIY